MKVFTTARLSLLRSSLPRYVLPLVTLLSTLAISNYSIGAETISDALTNAKIKLSLRLRYEDVGATTTDADLLSVKTRLSYSTDAFKGFSGVLEMDDITHATDFEGLIADPEGTEINQSFINYAFGDSALKYGRQRVLLDNQRFVGGVGFRQNEQTYDALSLTNKSFGDTEIFLANVTNVNRIFGEAVPAGDHSSDILLFNASYAGWSAGKLSVYTYLIDNHDALTFSSDTLGARFTGKTHSISYTFEYATQSDAADNPNDYDADYLLAEGDVKLGSFNLSLGYEVLGADRANGQFSTPLATLHAFQGWADVFLGGGTGNVTGGIEDSYFKAGTKLTGLNLLFAYHQFSADDSTVAGVSDYGSEIGLQITKDWDHYGLSLKYADYSEDGFSVDTKKLWLTATATF